MIEAFDRIVIAVPDLAVASVEYGAALGANFWPLEGCPEQARAWLGLANVVLELRELAVAQPAIVGIVFIDKSAPVGEQVVHNARGLSLHISNGGETSAFRGTRADNQSIGLAVDHLVLHTADADACIQLFSVGLGLRLALDKNVPEWGGRMLFFRLGKLTLEVIERAQPETDPDQFWGIAYRCADIVLLAGQMEDSGVELSSVRTGRKPGTKVATFKSHALGIPTLMIEPAPAA